MRLPLPSEAGKFQNVLLPFIWKPKPGSGLDCLLCGSALFCDSHEGWGEERRDEEEAQVGTGVPRS